MRRVTECLLESFNSGDHAVSVRYAGDRDWTTLYIGPDRAEAHQHNTRAMLKMDIWQPYRAELEAMLTKEHA
jgi:hypothetical protein